jgi:nitroreductase
MQAQMTRSEVESVVHAATLAPSVLNTQPWRFVARDDGVLELHRDTGRTLPGLDPRHRALIISCGAALLNLRVAIAAAGWRPEVQLLPDSAQTSLLATVRAVEPAEPSSTDVRLRRMLPLRRSSRVPFLNQPLAPEMIVLLEKVAASERTTLQVLDSREAAEMTRLVNQADQAQRRDPQVRSEIAHWTNRAVDDVDGIPALALGPVPRDPRSLVRDFAMGDPVQGRSSAQFESDPTLAVLFTPGDDPVDWMRAGVALERTWLEATAAGLAVSLLTQPLEMSNLRWLTRPLTHGTGSGPNWWPQALFRLGRPLGATPPTPRRPVHDVLTYAGTSRCWGPAL